MLKLQYKLSDSLAARCLLRPSKETFVSGFLGFLSILCSGGLGNGLLSIDFKGCFAACTSIISWSTFSSSSSTFGNRSSILVFESVVTSKGLPGLFGYNFDLPGW